ncbi:MAG: hypothetical protein SFV24_25995 [Gemmatimonadales bacterium]|nr:hypothetical protein [Gemmatimonadota bacterium]MDX2061293.1 hypothetical protein [Gemmatimonadales bacterium]
MARPLSVSLVSTVRDPGDSYPRFAVETDAGVLRIRGHLSTGSRGWRLRAEASCRRSVVTLHVTAVEMESIRRPDLEHHEYEATVRVTRGGPYRVRVAHAFLLQDLGGLGVPRPVFEESATVPERVPG